MKRYKTLFLYASLAEYFISGCRSLTENSEVHVIHWSSKDSAPFQFDNVENINLYERDGFTTSEMLEFAKTLQPDIIVCSGWVDKGYLKVCTNFFKKIPTLLIVDNHWNGSLKQQVASLLSPYTLKRKFSHVFIPGKPQRKYAQKLGFKDDQILEGYYSANVPHFNEIFENRNTPEKRFLYLGRYVKLKGVFDLWQAFKSYREKGGKWELWCVGTGDEWDNRLKIEGVRHFGFLQQNEMEEVLKECMVYILPSHFEPWGVSVHEMAASGFPLLLSKEVGAGSKFLVEGQNGFSFERKSSEAIESLLFEMESKSSTEIANMGARSHELANTWTPDDWANRIINVLKVESK